MYKRSEKNQLLNYTMLRMVVQGNPGLAVTLCHCHAAAIQCVSSTDKRVLIEELTRLCYHNYSCYMRNTCNSNLNVFFKIWFPFSVHKCLMPGSLNSKSFLISLAS